MESPLVDVTIAVHSASRPVARAVASVVDRTEAAVRATVVAHNIDPEIIRAQLGAYATHASVRLLSLQDGIRSPAGPMNLGIAEATARFYSLLGSDDEFAAGAIDSWLAVQRRTAASVVIPRITLVDGSPDPYPPVRGGRRRSKLDADRDRLHYRSAPLGLIDRNTFGALRLTEGLASGEDLAFSSTLWMTASSIAYDLDGPPYVCHDDAEDRVTSAPRPVADDFGYLDAIEAAPWFSSSSRANRIALAVKIIRVHCFDAVAARLDTFDDAPLLHHEIAAVVDRISGWAPGTLDLLSRADRALIDAVSTQTPSSTLRELLERRRAYRSPAAQLPRNPLRALHRQAPFRTLLAGALSQRVGAG